MSDLQDAPCVALTLQVGAMVYTLEPVAELQEALRTCPPHHRDQLLDAYLDLYPEVVAQ